MTFFSLFKTFRLRKKMVAAVEKTPSLLEVEASLEGTQKVPCLEQSSLVPVQQSESMTPIGDLPPPIPSPYSSAQYAPPPVVSWFKKECLRLQSFLGKQGNSFLSSEKQQQAETIFSKVEYELSLLKKTSPQRDLLILRPSEHEAQWQLWKFPNKKDDVPTLLDDHALPLAPSQKTRLLAGVPTRDLIVIPLWISTEGDLLELIELELSSKHLLRRGMAEGLKTIPLETKEGRMLVVVLAPTSSPSKLTAPYLTAADQFEASARLLPHQYADLLVWRELGEVCFGFSRKEQFVWFSGTNETMVTPATIGLITRMTLRLEAEAILEWAPRSLHIFGLFSEEERFLLKSFIGMSATAIDHKKYNYYSELPKPIFSTPPLDLPDEAARDQRLHQEKSLRLKRGIALIACIYFCLLLLGGSSLFVKKWTCHYFQHRINREQPAIEAAKQAITQWQEFRPAIDPTAYPLDILAEIARQIHGEKIRLITLTGMDAKLQIVGEATDVTQAYHFIEQIKKIPELQEYEWTSGQPKLAGKSSVRFELEGSRSHAQTSSE